MAYAITLLFTSIKMNILLNAQLYLVNIPLILYPPNSLQTILASLLSQPCCDTRHQELSRQISTVPWNLWAPPTRRTSPSVQSMNKLSLITTMTGNIYKLS